jgi:large subunit ribosomal protein L3
MILGLWGKKIGMAQIFEGDKIVPVTAINVENWVVTGMKLQERDGYNALQVGLIRKRYSDQNFVKDWVKKPKQYFEFLREVRVSELSSKFVVGQKFSYQDVLVEGQAVDIFGLTKGHGFAGVVKRHSFVGAPASHGATMGKNSGSLGGARSRGKVFKGKKMAGHMGNKRHAVLGLHVVKMVDVPTPVVLVKGSIPGKSGSLVFIRKAS